MIGYKAFNKDLTCRGFQYEIGQTYELDCEPIPCKQGFHFCKTIVETYKYYSMSENTRICKIKAIGDINTDDNIKYCTNKIVICEEITQEWERRGNNNTTSSGYCNSGDFNSGNRNSGDNNSGNCNSGDNNSGALNSGDNNSGNWNSGNFNSGDLNSGAFNSGNHNSGKCNSGDFNSGNENSGDFNSSNYNSGDNNSGNKNSGDNNSGNWNSGNYNSGNKNSGDFNSGDFNSGDFNSSNNNAGVFNTEQHTLMMFDKPSDWTYDQWRCSDACRLLKGISYNRTMWVQECDMSEQEKMDNPSYKTCKGYLKVLDEKESAEIWWNNLTQEEKEIIFALPNFDMEKFKKCVGLD